MYELPIPGSPIDLAAFDATLTESARAKLERRGYRIQLIAADSAQLTERVDRGVHLWQPSPLVIEAMEHFTAANTERRALDLGCGSGRDAVYLALRGYEVDAIDVLPDALAMAEQLADHHEVRIATRLQNLTRDPSLPSAQYSIVAAIRFLQRKLFGAMAAALAPGGLLIFESLHERDARRGSHGSRQTRGVWSGELALAFVDLEILFARDEVERAGRCFSQLIARKSVASPRGLST